MGSSTSMKLKGIFHTYVIATTALSKEAKEIKPTQSRMLFVGCHGLHQIKSVLLSE